MDDRGKRTLARVLAERIYETMQEEFKASYKRGEKHGGKSLPTKSEEMDAIQEFFRFVWGSVGSNTGGYSTWDSAMHMKEALISALEQVVIEGLAIEPCHITGMHTPEHHLDRGPGKRGYICESQLSEALRHFIGSLGKTDREGKPEFTPGDMLPRKLHENCGWCRRVEASEDSRRCQRQAYTWANEIPPLELMERGS